MSNNQIVLCLKVLSAAALLAVMTACATPAQVTEAQTETRQIAQSAQSAADEANRAASEAMQVAREAIEIARAAQQSADTAQRCCTDLEQRLDQAMERLQAK
ncbi:MAG: hypothetical protein ACNA7J_00160 [Wenzhouxiangella sp.]